MNTRTSRLHRRDFVCTMHIYNKEKSMASRGVEARIISHIDGSDSSCLIIGNDMRGTLVGVRMESDFTVNQLKSGLSNLVDKGEITHCLTDYGAREYRLTERGQQRAEKLSRAKKVPLWV